MIPLLSVSNLTVRRGEATLIDHLDWRIHRGEHWVILGANGSGKTSLLRALGGYLTPSEGEIHLLGETFGEADWRELRTRLGFISSSIAALLPDDESALNIVIGGRHATAGIWGSIRRKERSAALATLRQVEAVAVAEKPWSILSQGERQRVLIARALMARPRLLLLDESCAGLDPVARDHFLSFLDRLATRPRAVPLVMITHHVEEIRPAFTHVLVLVGGRALAAGPIGEVLTTSTLSHAFGAPVRVHRHRDGYRLNLR